MNIGFFNSHMETLVELVEIAKKHNCKIYFGFYTSGEREIDADVIKKSGLTPELYEEMKDKMHISDSMSSSEQVWFELYDESTGLYNTMSYTENDTYFRVSKDNDDFVVDEEDEPSDELIEWLELNDKLWDMDFYTINEQHNPTVICGFGNDECVEDFRCYRNGMALKFCSDLVCDYLGEPRIDRVY